LNLSSLLLPLEVVTLFVYLFLFDDDILGEDVELYVDDLMLKVGISLFGLGFLVYFSFPS